MSIKTPWNILKIAGYIIAGIFGINLLYVLFVYSIRHEGWFLYNPTFGSHSNAELAWQIVYSLIVILISWGIISLSKKKLKSANQRLK